MPAGVPARASASPPIATGLTPPLPLPSAWLAAQRQFQGEGREHRVGPASRPGEPLKGGRGNWARMYCSLASAGEHDWDAWGEIDEEGRFVEVPPEEVDREATVVVAHSETGRRKRVGTRSVAALREVSLRSTSRGGRGARRQVSLRST